jgi:nucleoside-diphosphate-sugar epimerase
MRERPNSPYALVKQLTTNTAMMLYANYGFPTMVVRPGNLYGPGQSKNKFIPYIVEQLRQDMPLDVTLCEQQRDFIYIDDFAKAIHSLLKKANLCRGEIVNVSSGISIPLKEIIETYKEKLQSKSKINYGAKPYRANEIMDLRCDISKLLHICSDFQPNDCAFLYKTE